MNKVKSSDPTKKSAPTLTETFKRALDCATPLVGISTVDPGATMLTIIEKLWGTATEAPVPLVRWDSMKGFVPLNHSGVGSLSVLAQSGLQPDLVTGAREAIQSMSLLSGGTIVFALHLDRFLDEVPHMQGVWSLRDLFKSEPRRMLVLLGRDVKLPAELSQDVLLLEDNLPDDEERRTIIEEITIKSDVKISKRVVQDAVDATRGLATFPTEQLTAMAITPERDDIEIPMLVLGKRATIRQTAGLAFESGDETFDTIGGLEQITKNIRRMQMGPHPKKLFIRMEEMDKAFAGTGTNGGPGDNTGTAQQILATFLTRMEDDDHSGIVEVGAPGTGKSLVSKAAGKTFGCESLIIDLGSVLNSLLGESQRAIREVFRTIKSLAGHGGAFFLANCNRPDMIPSALLRRFRDGIYYFDPPTTEELVSIWRINIERYFPGQKLVPPPHEGWSGANVRNCCDIAYRYGCSLADAATMIVPLMASDAVLVQRLREAAHDRYLSASYPGPYRNRSIGGSTEMFGVRRESRNVTAGKGGRE